MTPSERACAGMPNQGGWWTNLPGEMAKVRRNEPYRFFAKGFFQATGGPILDPYGTASSFDPAAMYGGLVDMGNVAMMPQRQRTAAIFDMFSDAEFAGGAAGAGLMAAVPWGKACPKYAAPATVAPGVCPTSLIRSSNSGLKVNPFFGKTFNEIDGLLKSRGFTTKGPDPIGGKGSYFHPETGRKYYLDPGGMYRAGTELPHVDVHYFTPDGGCSNVAKRKYPLGDQLIVKP